MSKNRFSPTRFPAPLFDDINAAAVMSDANALPAVDKTAIALAAELDAAAATVTVRVWARVRTVDITVPATPVDTFAWFFVADVILTAHTTSGTAGAPGPIIATKVQTQLEITNIPPCAEVKCEVTNISAGNATVWGSLGERVW